MATVFSWPHTLKLSMLAGGPACSQSATPSAKGQFAKRKGPAGKSPRLFWLRPLLRFNRLDLFQTSRPTNCVDTQGEEERGGKRHQRSCVLSAVRIITIVIRIIFVYGALLII